MEGVSAIEKRLSVLDGIFSQFQDVCDGQAREIRKTNCPYAIEEIRAHLDALKEKERVLKVGIIGRVKAGKSSLINALLFDGQNILPKAATPMTAALTSIGHGSGFGARVEFFSKRDFETLRERYDKYSESERIVEARKAEMMRRGQEKTRLLAAGKKAAEKPVSEAEEGRWRQAKAVVEDPGLKSAAEQWARISQAGLDRENLPEERSLEAASESELCERLNDYVGADGKFMPVTRTLHITMPVDSLSDLQVVDTPGLDDPVVSRSQRTEAMLKECNVVFIVSPAGQFLHAQDLALANQLTKREGVQEIFVVASQIDTQLHGSECEKHGGQFLKVLDGLQKIMGKQMHDALMRQNNTILKDIANQPERLLVTSGICQTLLARPESEWDESARHAFGLLKENYADDFSADKSQAGLKALAGRDALLGVIASVRNRKEVILAKQCQDFIQAQEASSATAIRALQAHFSKRRQEIQESDIAETEKQLNELGRVRDKGLKAVNLSFADQVDELDISLGKQLRAERNRLRGQVLGSVEDAKGSETETYRVKQGGLGGVKRFFGGLFGRSDWGYDERTRTVFTFNPSAVRNGIEEVRQGIQDGLMDLANEKVHYWRRALNQGLLQKLRESIGDDRVDDERLSSSIRIIVNQLRDIPRPTISDLPAELQKSGKLIGSEAEAYLEDAFKYINELFSGNADAFINRILSEIRKMADFGIGEKLFDHLEEEMTQLRDMVQNKQITLGKMERIIAMLAEKG